MTVLLNIDVWADHQIEAAACFCGGRITVQLCGGKVRKPTRYWTNNDYDRDNNTKNEGGGEKGWQI